MQLPLGFEHLSPFSLLSFNLFPERRERWKDTSRSFLVSPLVLVSSRLRGIEAHPKKPRPSRRQLQGFLCQIEPGSLPSFEFFERGSLTQAFSFVTQVKRSASPLYALSDLAIMPTGPDVSFSSLH